MKIVFSWDDGAIEDQHLFEIHEKYKIPGIFFVPTHNREGREVLSPSAIKNSESKYVSFGGHTYNHIYLTSIPIQQVEEEVLANKEYLESILGHSIDHFCLPGGKYNTNVLSIVKKHFKTIRTADTMSFVGMKDSLLFPSIHFYPRGVKSLIGNAIRHNSYHVLPYLFSHSNDPYFSLLAGLINLESARPNSIVIIWGHSWELEEYGLWNELDNFMASIKDKYDDCISDYSCLLPINTI